MTNTTSRQRTAIRRRGTSDMVSSFSLRFRFYGSPEGWQLTNSGEFGIGFHRRGGISGAHSALDPRDRRVRIAAQMGDDGGLVQHDRIRRIDLQRAPDLALGIVEIPTARETGRDRRA